MENDNRPSCPHCGRPLIKKGSRPDGRQKWKCKNEDCHYYITDDAKIYALKTNAINFFIDFLRNLQKECNAKKSKNIKLNLRKTKFENNKNPKLKFEKIVDVDKVNILNVSKCFIIQLNEDSIDLISTRFADSRIIFCNDVNPDVNREFYREEDE